MTKEEVIKILLQIEAVYPDFLTKNETVSCWFTFATVMDYAKVKARLCAHIRRSPYPPRLFQLTDITAADFPSGCGDEDMNKNQPILSWMDEYSLKG